MAGALLAVGAAQGALKGMAAGAAAGYEATKYKGPPKLGALAAQMGKGTQFTPLDQGQKKRRKLSELASGGTADFAAENKKMAPQIAPSTPMVSGNADKFKMMTPASSGLEGQGEASLAEKSKPNNLKKKNPSQLL